MSQVVGCWQGWTIQTEKLLLKKIKYEKLIELKKKKKPKQHLNMYSNFFL
jgi:hypothetical protein